MVASVDALLLLQQLEELTENPPSHVMNNDKLRIKLRDAARNFSIAMETEGDTIHRIKSLVYYPRIPHGIASLCFRTDHSFSLFNPQWQRLVLISTFSKYSPPASLL